MAKVLLLLNGPAGEDLAQQLASLVMEVFSRKSSVTVQLMQQLEQDPFHDPAAALPRPQLVLELQCQAGEPLGNHYDALAQVLQGVPLSAESLALVMHSRCYIPCAPQPVHYHQLMFRRAGLALADYMDYYTRFHCRMGFNTPVIAGYIQNYIDAAASDSLARRLGLATVEADSISELTMENPESMLAAPQLAEVAGAAAQDEERFLDRSRNVAFCSEVVLRLGDFEAIREAAFAQHFPAPGC